MSQTKEYVVVLNHLIDIIDPNNEGTYLRHESFFSQISVIAEVEKLFDDFENTKVLEIGCGKGLLCMTLAKIGFNVTASDHLESTEEHIKTILTKAGYNVTVNYKKQNLEEDTYCFEKNSYDVVIAVDVFEHVLNVRIMFENIKKCLKPNGIFIIHTPNYARFNVRLKAFKNIFYPVWPIRLDHYLKENPFTGHIREFTPKELVKIYKLHDFEIIAHRFPKSVSLGRKSNYCKGLLGKLLKLSWLFQELINKVFSKLGHSQLVIGRKIRTEK
jgi:2-polyprenyl-3-methyl-5-hydroxy-6-metoxy-1,4-benzoquinol methylase